MKEPCCLACQPIQGFAHDGVDKFKIDCRKPGKKWKYIGLDTKDNEKAYGNKLWTKNVNLTSENPHTIPLDDNSIDVVVSTSCLEHDTMFWVTFKEMVRVIKDKGYIYLNAPSGGTYHGFPKDCWRFLKDAWEALSTYEPKAKLIEQYIHPDPMLHGGWADNIGIFEVRK